MITERVDERTGTIVFEEDEESRKLRLLIRKFKELEQYTKKLEERIRKLENNKKKEDS